MWIFVAQAAIIAACFALAVFAGTPVVRWLLKRIENREAVDPPATPVEPESSSEVAQPPATPTQPDMDGEVAQPPGTPIQPDMGGDAAQPLERPVEAVTRRGSLPVTHTQPPDVVSGLGAAGEALKGGYWIGLLERAALFACVLSGFPAGIAVVLGVKGLGRYPELRRPAGGKGELFIIGTFASMLWSALWSGLAYGLVRLW